jgi:CRP-like cAMP-binding protein
MATTLDLFRNETDGPFYSAGQTIFAQGDMGDSMFVVLEGEVELAINGSVRERLGPGEPFGEMALIDRAPRVATVVAITDCRLVVISEKRFLFLIQQTPYFALQIMKVMAERLRKMDFRS